MPSLRAWVHEVRAVEEQEPSEDILLRHRIVGDAAVLDVAGELDIATSPTLKAALEDLMDHGYSCLVINLLRTTYLDSTALSVLSLVRKRAVNAGGNLGIVYEQPHLEKVFMITRLHEEFPVFRSEVDALDATRAWSTDSRKG